MTVFSGRSGIGNVVALSCLASQMGCQRTEGTLRPQYDEASAPRVYHFRSLYPTLFSGFGTSDGKRLWAVGAEGAILESSDGERWNVDASGTTNYLYSILGTSDGKHLWVVGANGTILESNDGERWIARISGISTDLYSVFGSSDGKQIWAVGAGGAVLKSDDGEHWNELPRGTSENLFCVFATSDGKRLWAAGAEGTILESSDGEHWKTTTSGTQNTLRRLFGTNDGKRLWAVGDEGTILESDDGEHWAARKSGTQEALVSIFGSSDGKQVWAVGAGGLILESSDGKSWILQHYGMWGSLQSIFGSSDGRRLWALGEEGTVLESSDGERWTIRTNRPSNLRSIFGIGDAKRLWAVGDDGAILESSDGERWIARASGTRKGLSSIFGTSDGTRLWAVGEAGTILESSDGEHWKARASGTDSSLHSIFGASDGKRLWAVGDKGTILESGDGEHWGARSSGVAGPLLCIAGTSDGRRLWAVGVNGTILESSDGEHWMARDSRTRSDLYSIFGTGDGKHLWAVGSAGAILESNDGEHWNIRDIGRPNSFLNSLFGTDDGKMLWAVGYAGTIVESNDGRHWNALASGTEEFLTSIYVTGDGKRLWTVGNNGTFRSAARTSVVAPFVTEARLSSGTSGDFFELTMSDRAKVGLISMSALNDYEYDLNQRRQREWPEPATCTQVKQTDQWRCGLDKATLHPEVKGSGLVPTLHFLIRVQRDGGDDTYEFTALYNPWAIFTDHPWIVSIAGVILVLTVIPTILLFVRPLWNIKLYRALKLHQIEKIDLPGVGGFLQLVMRLVTVLPWFITTRRTLDAWVLENCDGLVRAWPHGADQEGLYVPLPIRKGDPTSGEQILQPGASDIRAVIAEPRTTIQIIGQGGAGKTTLARQIGRWGFENGSQSGIASYPTIPIWVDEESDAEKKPLRSVVKGKLQAALPDEEIDDVLFGALLEKQRLLVFVDRLSERSAVMQDHVRTIYRSTKIGLLVVTSRTVQLIDGAQSVNFYPQPLDSDETLMRLMSGVLSVYSADDGKPLFPMEERFKLAARLAGLIRVHTNRGEQSVPLTPLPVRLFVEQAVQLVREGKPLDDLPVSLPEVYLRQLRMVNPQDAGLPHFVDDDRMLKVAKILAKTALGGDYIPKEFNRSAAVAALLAAGEVVTVGCDPIKRLALNGVLTEKPGGLNIQLRFALDPVAEILAAVACGEECGRDMEKWDSLEKESRRAPGFAAAVELVFAAYWWPEGEGICGG